MISISFFFYLAKVFGLAPFVLQVDSNNEKARFQFLRRIPTFLMIAFYAISICSVFYKNQTVSAISNTANWIQFIPNSAIFFIVLVAADRSRKHIQKIGCYVQELDQKLKCYQVSHVASNTRIKRLAIFATFLVIFCGINIATLHFAIGVNPSDIDSIFYWLAFVIAKIGLLTFNFMFALYMTVLLERLRIVCKTIDWLIELPSKAMPTKEMREMSALSAITNIIVPYSAKADFIDSIYEIVEILQKICSKMNLYFGKKVIFTILSAFICLTVQLFYLINHIRHGFRSDRAILCSAASCSLIFMHILELWVIFISGHQVKDMWNSLIKKIQGMKRKFVTDETFKARIDELVSIMVFTRVEMRASGFFNIDLSVITSIVSSIATYLVVLVQFKLTEEETARNLTAINDMMQFSQGASMQKSGGSEIITRG